MKTWEYKSVPFSIWDWNFLGSEGWELVSTNYNPKSYVVIGYFKRETEFIILKEKK